VGTVIGDLLPLAVGIAISPIPIIAVILMLLSPQAGKTSTGFLLGWVAGIVVVTTVVLVLVGQAGNTSSGSPSTVSSVLKLAFGVLLLLLALKQWRQRPKEGEVATMPKWMSATIGAAHLSGGEDVIVVAIFTVIAASTVGIPVVGYLAARSRMEAPLNRLRAWLTQNNASVMAVLLLVIGAVLLGKGIGGLSAT
jgi:amino acid transporter